MLSFSNGHAAEACPVPDDRRGVPRLLGGDTDRFELVEGEPVAMAPASGTHGTIPATIVSILRADLRSRQPRCRVVAEPGIAPRINAEFNLKVPDPAVTCSPNTAGERAVPDPVLIIEILSPSNEAETHRNVWAYASIPSVREILLVRSTEIAGELLCRLPDGNWPDRPEAIGASAEGRLDSIGFSGRSTDFYEDTHLARRTRP